MLEAEKEWPTDGDKYSLGMVEPYILQLLMMLFILRPALASGKWVNWIFQRRILVLGRIHARFSMNHSFGINAHCGAEASQGLFHCWNLSSLFQKGLEKLSLLFWGFFTRGKMPFLSSVCSQYGRIIPQCPACKVVCLSWDHNECKCSLC